MLIKLFGFYTSYVFLDFDAKQVNIDKKTNTNIQTLKAFKQQKQ